MYKKNKCGKKTLLTERKSSDQLQSTMPKQDRMVHFANSIGTPLAIDMEDMQTAAVLSNLVTCVESPAS